jgi:hypothetical protein
MGTLKDISFSWGGLLGRLIIFLVQSFVPNHKVIFWQKQVLTENVI